ncbi:MAG: ATP-binding cassette domain-containing protein [Ruminococcus sp.]|nr:ATP-binding cassette domain-containing protein [Ruminococcus sp.]
MHEAIVTANNLTKQYGSFTALENVDLTVYKGDIFGLIGRNGAGKTTLLKILSGLTESTDGDYSIFSKTGDDLRRQRRRIGCLIEEPAFFKNMTARENLKYYCLQKGITDLSQIDKVLETVALTGTDKKKYKDFSLGMQQRLGIAFALLDSPDLVMLDEPINGIDPIGVSELRDTFFRLNRERDVTLIISSHILSELYAVANRFLIIDKGKVIKDLTKEELDEECSMCTVLRTDNAAKTATVLEGILGITEYEISDNDEVRITQQDIEPMLITKTLVENGIGVGAIFESGLSLEDYFKKLISAN